MTIFMWPTKLGKSFTISSYQININQNNTELEAKYLQAIDKYIYNVGVNVEIWSLHSLLVM